MINSSNFNPDDLEDDFSSDDDYYEYENDDCDDEPKTYNQYRGSYAQDNLGYSDDFINDVLDGDPDNFINID